MGSTGRIREHASSSAHRKSHASPVISGVGHTFLIAGAKGAVSHRDLPALLISATLTAPSARRGSSLLRFARSDALVYSATTTPMRHIHGDGVPHRLTRRSSTATMR